jgi:hypothetical protein
MPQAMMYFPRFSYDVAPLHRQRAIDSLRHEVEAARKSGSMRAF